jgi:hypothetical protein
MSDESVGVKFLKKGLNLLDKQVTWKNLFKIPAGQTVFCPLSHLQIILPGSIVESHT